MFLCIQIYSQVGIGTTNPLEALHVFGANSQLRVDGLGIVNPLNRGEETPLAVDEDGKFVLSSSPKMELVAMGKILADGTVIKSSGATILKLNTGDYEISFLSILSDKDYIISLTVNSHLGSSTSVARYYDQTKSSFKVNTTISQTKYSFLSGYYMENIDTDNSFMFIVYKIN
jgi:hypothetical protein